MSRAVSRPTWDFHDPHSSLGQAWVKTVRKIYNPIGFQKGYNFPLFLIGASGLMGFVLARFFYLDYNGVFSRDAIPGEFYYYKGGHYKVGIIMHLVGILCGGFLASLQFIPVIRHKLLLFHRINGYAAIILFLLANAGAFMIARHAVGGPPVLQVWVGVVGVMTTIAILLAYVNIKRLQTDQHRIWMLRTWTWAASIISLRLIILAGKHVSEVYGYVWYGSMSCAEIFYMYQHVGVPDPGNPTAKIYPACGTGPRGQGVVDPSSNTATFVTVSSVGSGPENAGAIVRAMFPMAAWLAIVIHVLVLEIYLWLTPAEHHRLRTVSYQRQVEAGMRAEGDPKDAGLTATRLGDAPQWWSMPTAETARGDRPSVATEDVTSPESELDKPLGRTAH